MKQEERVTGLLLQPARSNAGLIYSLRLARSASRCPFDPCLSCVTVSFLVIREKICFALAQRTILCTSLFADIRAWRKCLWAEFSPHFLWWLGALVQHTSYTTRPWPCSRTSCFWGGYTEAYSVLTHKVPAPFGFLWFPAEQTCFSALQTLIT